MHVQDENIGTFKLSGNTVDLTRKLSFKCMSAAFAMQSLMRHEPRSIILTSGTLAPMDSFQIELGITFHHKLQNNHVIPKRQVFISSLRVGTDGN